LSAGDGAIEGDWLAQQVIGLAQGVIKKNQIVTRCDHPFQSPFSDHLFRSPFLIALQQEEP